MTEKTMMGVLVTSELIGVAVVVLVALDQVGVNVAIAAGLLLGPMLIAAYHFTFIAPHTFRLARRNFELEEQIKALLSYQSDYRAQLRQSQALLQNLTAVKRRQTRPSFVYFVADRNGDHVKIGVSHDPDKRLSSLQTGNRDKLHLLAVVEGDSSLEQEYHERFKHLRRSGEWFALAPELTNFIQDLIAEEQGKG